MSNTGWRRTPHKYNRWMTSKMTSTTKFTLQWVREALRINHTIWPNISKMVRIIAQSTNDQVWPITLLNTLAMVDVQTFRILQQFGKSNCTNQKNGNIGEFLEGLYTHTLALNGIMALATSPLFHTVFPRGSLPSERQIGRSKFMQGNHIVNRTRNCTISTCANRVILSQCFSESLCTNQRKTQNWRVQVHWISSCRRQQGAAGFGS